MIALLDQHCPTVTVRRRANKKTTPWFDVDCRAARRRTRAAERRFKRMSSGTDHHAWSIELSKMKELYEKKNSTFWRSDIATSQGNTQRLWRTLHSALGESAYDDSCVHTADDFAAFFKDKIDTVRVSTTSIPLYDVPSRSMPTLESWTPVTTDEIEKLIGSSPCKTCQLDPVPTWLIKNMKTFLSPFIIHCSASHWLSVVFHPTSRKLWFAHC